MSEKEKPWVIDYPDLEVVDLNDIEVQKDLIRKGVLVGMPGGELIFTKSVKLIAGGAKT